MLLFRTTMRTHFPRLVRHLEFFAKKPLRLVLSAVLILSATRGAYGCGLMRSRPIDWRIGWSNSTSPTRAGHRVADPGRATAGLPRAVTARADAEKTPRARRRRARGQAGARAGGGDGGRPDERAGNKKAAREGGFSVCLARRATSAGRALFGQLERWWSQTESNRRPLQCH